MLQTILEFFNWAGLKLNASKCGALSMISNRNQKYVKPFEPQVDEANSILKWEDAYKYLGIQLGRDRRGTMDDLAQSMLSAAKEICSSVLADWQKTRRHQYLCHPKGLLLPRRVMSSVTNECDCMQNRSGRIPRNCHGKPGHE